MSFEVTISPQMLTSLSVAQPDDQQTRSAVFDTLVLIIESIEFTRLQSLNQDCHSRFDLIATNRDEELCENNYGYMTEDMNSELEEVERMLLDEIAMIKGEQSEEMPTQVVANSSLLRNSSSTAEIPTLHTQETIIAEEVDLRDANLDALSWLNDEIVVLRYRTEHRKQKRLEALREASAIKLQRICRGGLTRRWIRIKSQLSQTRNKRRTQSAFYKWLQKRQECNIMAKFMSSALVDEVLQSDLSVLVTAMLDEAVQEHNITTAQNSMTANPPSQAVVGILSRPGTSERRQRKRSVSFASGAGVEEQRNTAIEITLNQTTTESDNITSTETMINIGKDSEISIPVHKKAIVQTTASTPSSAMPPSTLDMTHIVTANPLQPNKNWQDCDQSAAFSVGRGLKLFKPPKPLQIPQVVNDGSVTGAKDLFRKQSVPTHQSQVSAFLEMMNDSHYSNFLRPRKDSSLSSSISTSQSAFSQLLQQSSNNDSNSSSGRFKAEISSSSSARNTLDMSVEGLSSLFFLQSMPSPNSTNSSSTNFTSSNSSIVAPTVNKLMLNINKLTSLDGIEIASNTRYLSIADNQISSLRQLEMLRELEFLNGDSNRLDTLDLGPLDHLATLSLNCNSIRQIDRIACPKLRRLELYSNRIAALNAEKFKVTPSLTYLNLGRNEITDFDGMALSQALPLLHTLILSQNRLSTVPQLMLPCLRTLWLNGNGLEGQLSFSTTSFRFNSNTQSWLPSLKSLYLHDNRLSMLSSSLLNAMPMLSELDLSFNRFDNQSSFQPLVQSCERLESLKVNDNAMPMSEMPYVKQWVRSVFPLIRLFNGEESSTTMACQPNHDRIDDRSKQLQLLTNIRLREEYQVMVSKKRWQRAKKGYVKITDPSLEIDSDLLSILKDKVRILCGGEALTMCAIAKELHLSYLQLPAVEELLTAPAKAVSNTLMKSDVKASTNRFPVTEAVSNAHNDFVLEEFSSTTVPTTIVTTAAATSASTLIPNAPPTLSLDAAKERCAIRIQRLLKAHRRKKQTRQVIRSVRYEDDEIAHILGNDTEDIDALLNFDWMEQVDDSVVVALPKESSSIVRSLSSSATNIVAGGCMNESVRKSEAKRDIKDGHKPANREDLKMQDIAEEDETSSATMSFVYGDHIRRRGQYNKSLEFNNQHPSDTMESPPKSVLGSARESVQQRESKASKLKEDWGITDPKLLETMMKRNKQNQKRKKKAQVISL